MSLFANIDHLAAADGVVGVLVEAPQEPRLFRGLERWRPLLAGALDLLRMTEEPSIRLVIGEHTLVVQHEMSETVAVVIPTGHGVAKSLRRMIRRMARKDRGPYVPPTPQPTVSAENQNPPRPPSPPQGLPTSRPAGAPVTTTTTTTTTPHGSPQPGGLPGAGIPGWDRFSG